MIRTDTRIPVPVPDLSLLRHLADPDDLDTSWSLPDSRKGASVPVEGLASVAFPELHSLEGVRQGRALQLSSWRGWADTGGHSRTRVRSQLRTFSNLGKSAKNPFTRLTSTLFKHQLESEKKMNLVLGENHEDLHLKQEYQRSAPQPAQKCVPKRKATLLNSVLGENLELAGGHDHVELECRRSAPRCAKETGRSALPPTVPLTAAQEQENEKDTVSKRSWALR